MTATDTVVFLGAGASAAEGAPIQANLFREYFEFNRSRSSHAAHHEWDRELATFFQQFFGIDVDNHDLAGTSFPTFEETLGMLELAESQEESFRDWPGCHLIKDGTSRIRHIHDLLVFLIGEILQERLNQPKRIHYRLLDNLERHGRLHNTAFVSFNYDILIDNAMLDLLGEGHSDYGFDFVNQTRPRLGLDRTCRLFKLHGSLNWLFCSACRDMLITPHSKGVMKLKWEPHETVCNRCEGPRSPIVIPPTFFKVMSNLFLRIIWDGAERACSEARRLVFCGYSFPDADVHVRYLVKRGEVNSQRTPEVFVVNTHAGKAKEMIQQEMSRYRRFFVAKNRVRYTDVSFEEFADDPHVIEDSRRWQ